MKKAILFGFMIASTAGLNAQNVGIGTATPIAKLHVDGGRMEVTTANEATGTAGTGVIEVANSLRIDGNEVVTNTGTVLHLQNGNNGDLRVDGSTLMVDASANRVGVGTASPDSKLGVNGNLSVGTYGASNAAPANGLNVSGQTIIGRATPLYASDQLAGYVTGANFAVNGYVNGGTAGAGIISSALYANVTGTGGTGLLIDHSATGDFPALVNAQTVGPVAAIKGDAGVDGPHGVYAEMPPGALISYALYSNGDFYISGGTFGPSDSKLKTNIQTYTSGLATIMALQPKSYDYKPKFVQEYGLSAGKQVGFLAQEIEQILPTAVRSGAMISKAEQSRAGGASPETMNAKGVNYVSLIPILTQAIQEQQSQIESLKEEIEQLKSK